MKSLAQIIQIKEYQLNASISKVPTTENELQAWFTTNVPPDRVEHCWVYIYAVALRLKEKNKIIIDFNDDDPFATLSVLEEWERFFKFDDNLTRMYGLPCPWQVISDTVLTLPQAIIDYCITAKKYNLEKYRLPFINGDEGLEILSQRLNRNVADVSSNRQLAADIMLKDISVDDFLRLVYASKGNYTKGFQEIAANSLSILVMAKVPMTCKDFSFIKIPFANLSYGNFDSTSFRGADLTNVIATGAWFRNTDFSHASMRGFATQEVIGLKNNFNHIGDCKVIGDDIFFSTNKSVQMWNYSQHQCIKQFDGHTEVVIRIDTFMLEDERYVVSADSNGTLHIWNSAFQGAGKSSPYKSFTEVKEFVSGCYYSKLTQTIIIAYKHKIISWDFQKDEYQVLNTFQKEIGIRTKLSPNGKLLAYEYKDAVVFFNLQSNKIDASYPIPTGIGSIAFSADEKYCAVGYGQLLNAAKHGSILLIGLENSKTTTLSHAKINQNVTSLCFTPDDKYIVTGHSDSEIILWQIAQLEAVGILEKSYFSPQSIKRTFSVPANNISFIIKDNEYSLTATFKEKLMTWKYNLSLFVSLDTYYGKIIQLTLLPNKENRCVISTYNEIRIIDLTTGHTEKKLNGSHRFAISVDGQYIAYTKGRAIENATLVIYNLTLDKIHATIPNYPTLVNDFAFSVNNNLIASAHENWKIFVWDIATRKLINTFESTSIVKRLKFLPNNFIVSANFQGRIEIWDQSKLINNFGDVTRANLANPLTNVSISALEISNNTSYLVFGNHDNGVIINHGPRWDDQNRFARHNSTVKAISISPDRSIIASGGADGLICLWGVKPALGYITSTMAHEGVVTNVCFTQDGKTLISCGDDKEIHAWELIEKPPGSRPHTYDFINAHNKIILLVLKWRLGSRLFAKDMNLHQAAMDQRTHDLFNQLGAIDSHTALQTEIYHATDCHNIFSLTIKDLFKVNLKKSHGGLYGNNHVVIEEFGEMIEKVILQGDFAALLYIRGSLSLLLVEPINERGQTCLMLAAHHGHMHMVHFLVQQTDGYLLDIRDKDGNNALNHAAFNNHLNIVKYLHSHSIDLDNENIFGVTPLLIAVNKNYFPLVRFLVVNGADIKHADKKGNTPLSLAREYSLSEMLHFIVLKLHHLIQPPISLNRNMTFANKVNSKDDKPAAQPALPMKMSK